MPVNNSNAESQVHHHRCVKCKKLLGIENTKEEIFEIKCSRCGTLNSLLGDRTKQIFLTDAKGVIIFANDKVIEVTGFSQEEIIGKTPTIWGGQMPHEFYMDLWQKILHNKKAVSVKLINKRKDQSLYEVSMQISPILNSLGDVEFFLAIETVLEKSTEITE